ncbi:hypothetical protein C8R48DRAFT_721320 [Suillus tomentosus]|nr:hypothetical protein C8R48DRAFT_721320 [Suillus tomentosus]
MLAKTSLALPHAVPLTCLSLVHIVSTPAVSIQQHFRSASLDTFILQVPYSSHHPGPLLQSCHVEDLKFMQDYHNLNCALVSFLYIIGRWKSVMHVQRIHIIIGMFVCSYIAE